MADIKNIILIEDDEHDVELIEMTLKNSPWNINFIKFSNGSEAYKFLDTPTSIDLVLLDINLPGQNGKEILEKLRTVPSYAYTPVLMLTSSKNQADIIECYDLGANAYIVKPINYSQLKICLNSIFHFWFKWSAEPNRLNH